MIDLSEFGKKYPYKTELHAHSLPVSGCSHVSADKMVELYAKMGCDSIVLTNHLYGEKWMAGDAKEKANEYLEDYRVAKAAGERLGVNVILGVEIRFTENKNDYLVYGVSEEDIPVFIGYLDKGIDIFYKECKTEKNLILQAHPFRSGMILADPHSIDGIETFNLHPNHNSRIGIASRYARENEFVISGGTDFHEADHRALCLARTESKLQNSYEVAELLRSKNYFFDISGNFVFVSQE